MNNIIATIPHYSCDICGAKGATLYPETQDLLFGVSGSYSYSQCSNPECELIWQNPMIIPEEAGRAYENYYTHAEGKMKKKGLLLRRIARVPAHLSDSIFLKLFGIKKLRKKMRYMGLLGTAPGHLLEIGCGRGEKLILFRDLGWQVTGQEIDPNAAKHASQQSGINVLCGDLPSLNLEGEKFDAIIMSHVIEHIFDIPGYLRECLRLLKPGGRLIITTPNGNSLGHKKFREFWRGLEPPRHLHIFSPKNMQLALQNADFDTTEIWSNAAGSRGVFEASYQLRDNGQPTHNKYPKTLIYYKSIYLQYKEWVMCRRGTACGEELVATATKSTT